MKYRSYITKDTTIISNSTLNLGANPLNRLFFTGTLGRENYSRVIMGFDINPLIQKYNNCELGDLSKVTHKLTVYPTRYFDISDSEDCQATSFEICLFKINQEWSEGCGYDEQCDVCDTLGYPLDYFNIECRDSKGAANWFDAQENVPWETEGIIDPSLYLSPEEFNIALETAIEQLDSGDVTSGTVITLPYSTGTPYMICKNYSCDEKVITFDVTDDVNEHILSGTPHYGYGIAFSKVYEDNPRGITKTFGFYSKESSTYFKPFLETTYDFALKDNRTTFYGDVNNNLYLYVNINGNPVQLDTNPLVDVYSPDGEIFGTYTGECVDNGVYGINLTIPMSGDVICGLWEDVWKNISYNGRSLGNVTREFELKSNENYFSIGGQYHKPKQYYFKLSGIKDMEYIRKGDIRKVIINVYEKFTRNKPIPIDNLEYRLYIKEGEQQYDIIEWSNVNIGECDNYIYIDTGWLLPQSYYLDFKVKTNGEEKTYPNEIKFVVLEDLENKLH